MTSYGAGVATSGMSHTRAVRTADYETPFLIERDGWPTHDDANTLVSQEWIYVAPFGLIKGSDVVWVEWWRA